METQTKQLGKFDVSIYENIGRYYVTVESEDTEETEIFVAKFEAQERYDNMECENDARLFLEELRDVPSEDEEDEECTQCGEPLSECSCWEEEQEEEAQN